MELVYGAGKLDRRVPHVERLLREWRDKERDFGQLYLEHVPATPRDRLLVEDLAATMLVNSRVAARAATSVYRHGATVDLRLLPDKALEETNGEERQQIARVIGTMTGWPWVGASLATKTLHKKRPALIPILDNQAIFGAYMNPSWPEKRSLMDTIKAVPRIKEALDWIAADVTRPENESTWSQLQEIEPERSRIELFDIGGCISARSRPRHHRTCPELRLASPAHAPYAGWWLGQVGRTAPDARSEFDLRISSTSFSMYACHAATVRTTTARLSDISANRRPCPLRPRRCSSMRFWACAMARSNSRSAS